ncbi:hypothetical protein CGZ80_17470 [Rhodopirellula sp. MGV]|nr:hypothetical protein CGZ80_17470 [Rhodopirellula sp. MGV]
MVGTLSDDAFFRFCLGESQNKRNAWNSAISFPHTRHSLRPLGLGMHRPKRERASYAEHNHHSAANGET